MKNLGKLGLSVVMSMVFGLSAFAGETHSPPAPPPPGSMQGLGAPSSGQMPTPPVASSETSFTEFAASILESILPLL